MNYSGFMEFVYTLTEWITRFATINILWIITNLPVILIIVLMTLNQATANLIVLAISLIILLPTLFVPSLVSVFENVRDWILDKEESSHIRGYWRHLKNNYKKNMVYGLILTFIWGVWIIDFFYFKELSYLLWMVMIFIGPVLFVFSINIINLHVHYILSYKSALKNAFFLTVGKPLLSLAILICNVSLLYVSLTKAWFLLPFFTITLCAFSSFYVFYRIILNIRGEISPK